jgi:hypothetical protein
MTKITEIKQAGFYKLTPINQSGEKVKFMWMKVMDEEEFTWYSWAMGTKFRNGCEFSLADKNDKDFIDYIKSDIITVEKEIQDKILLKQRLIEAI